MPDQLPEAKPGSPRRQPLTHTIEQDAEALAALELELATYAEVHSLPE